MGNHRYGIDNKPVLWSGYLMLMNEEMMSSYLFRPQPHWGETVRDGGQYFPIPKEGRQRRQWHPTPVLLPGKSHGWRSLVGCSPCGREESDTTEQLPFTFHFHALEKEMATHSSILAWRIPGTGEPGGLPSVGSHRVRHD